MEHTGYGFSSIYQELSAQNVLAGAPEASLWRYYLGMDFQIGKDICSPLRRDKRPSFQIYTGKTGKLMFKDHGGDGKGGDIIDFVCHKESLSFTEALVKINSDFKLGLGRPDQQTYKGYKSIGVKVERQLDKFEEQFSIANASFIQVFTRPYGIKDIKYWDSYGITQETLRLYSVHCIDKAKLNGVVVYTHSEDNPGYVYHFPASKHNKCYFPFNKDHRRRFISSANNYEDIQGYYQCDVKVKGKKLLVLTKSMKDVMVLRELGYDAMAIHGETQYFYKDFIRHVKKYYPRIISLYDRDRAGMKGAKYLWKQHSISPYFIHKSLTHFGVKDISDMYKTVGRGQTEEFMKKISGL